MLARWKALAGAALLVLASTAAADTYPSKSVRWIVPYPPGGSNDVLSRITAQAMR